MRHTEPYRSYNIVVCDNDDCRLRFPALADDPRSQRCPLCGSSITRVLDCDYDIECEAPGASTQQSRIHLLLDNIRSAFNVGSIFRIADGAGVSHIYLCGITPTPENPKVAKTALGAESTVAWSYHRNALDLAQELTSSGRRLIALERTADSIPLFTVSSSVFNGDMVLIAGNELTGVDPGLLHMTDAVIHLPMSGVKGSLNVAVAMGIAVYWLCDQTS